LTGPDGQLVIGHSIVLYSFAKQAAVMRWTPG
jgi:hypothetical protein